MYDRPTAAELIDAVRLHLETVLVPAIRDNHKLYFQTLVAINVLRIVERELGYAPQHSRAAWARLNMLLGSKPMPETAEGLQAALAERNAALCAEIRAGRRDTDAELFEHLKAAAIEQLEVANPRFLQVLAAEDAHTGDGRPPE